MNNWLPYLLGTALLGGPAAAHAGSRPPGPGRVAVGVTLISRRACASAGALDLQLRAGGGEHGLDGDELLLGGREFLFGEAPLKFRIL